MFKSDQRTTRPGRFLWDYSRQDKAFYPGLVTIPMASIFLGALLPFKMSSIFAKLAQGHANAITKSDFLQLIVIAFTGVILNRAGFFLLLRSQARSMEKLQNETLDNLLQKSAGFYANQMTGKLTTDVFTHNDSLLQYQDALIIHALPFAVSLISGLILVSVYSLALGMCLVLVTLVVLAMAIHSSNRRRPLRKNRQEATRRLRGYFADIVINNATVKLFAREEYEKRRHAKLNRDLFELRLRDWTKLATDGNNRIILILILQILFVLVTVAEVRQNPALLSVGIFAFTFTITLSAKLFEITTIMRNFENALTGAAPMTEILALPPEVKDPRVPLPFSVQEGGIEFKDVTFWYDEGNGKQALFDNLNIKILPGEKVGLVGPSGGGKTTITKLILRFMDIQGGQILIDGQDISASKQTDIRKAISYVPQEPMLFHRSLIDNIAYGKPGVGQAAIEKVSRDAHAHEFIGKLPNGYETVVGERGVKLSGGQRQRVAIARAMLKNSPILVLDEATSALDSEAESYIQEALWSLMKGKTAVVIAHRLSTIQKMDRIIVLSDGKIVEEGTHKQLLKKKSGLYSKLWKHQSGGFLQE